MGVQLGKAFLGISYILQGIPYINLLGFILVPIAWLVEGFRERKGLWVSAGISGLISFSLVIAGVISILQALHLSQLLRYSGMSMNSMPSSTLPENIMKALHGGNPALLSSLLIIVAGLSLGLIYFLLMLISVFQAGSIYSSSTLKVGGILYIIDVILIGVVIALAISSFATNLAPSYSPQLLKSLGAIYIASIITGVLALAASIITGIGFLVVREKPRALT